MSRLRAENVRSEVADVTGIVKYIGKSVFAAPKRWETLFPPPPILLGSSQFPVPFSFLTWRIVTILTSKLPFLVDVVIFC